VPKLNDILNLQIQRGGGERGQGLQWGLYRRGYRRGELHILEAASRGSSSCPSSITFLTCEDKNKQLGQVQRGGMPRGGGELGDTKKETAYSRSGVER
jgi:hypothetical protein